MLQNYQYNLFSLVKQFPLFALLFFLNAFFQTIADSDADTNADMKIYQCLRLHIKMICRRFPIIALFTFRDIRTRDV